MRALLLLPLLAACAAAPPPVAPPSFRDASLPVASTLRGAPADLAGEWVVTQSFPGGPWGDLLGGGVGIAADEAGAGTWTLRRADGTAAQVPVTPLGAGRFRAGGGPDLWVLWADDAFRTVVVGAPDGTAAWVMDRPGQSGADRAQAAREVLDFNGFDLGRLRGA